MRRLFLSIMLGVVAICLHAQDTMVTMDGDVKTVYVVDIGSTAVFYKAENTETASIQSISKSQIFVLKHADGTKYDLGSTDVQVAPVAQEAPVSTGVKQKEDIISEEAKRLNQELIEHINNSEPTHLSKEKYGDDNAWYVFFSMGVTENSTLINDEIEISMEIGSVPALEPGTGRANKKGVYSSDQSIYNHAFSVSIKNKTSRTLYIDLGNTFFVRGEAATAYYIPSATSTASTSSSGVSVNAGSVAGALGIGGSIGKLANGINVGGGGSSATVSVTYSQRVIAVPPKSSKILDYKYLFDGYSCPGLEVYEAQRYEPFFTRVNFLDVDGDKYKYMMLEKHQFNPSSSPLRFSFFVTYSDAEDCVTTKSMEVNLFVKEIIGSGCYNDGDALDTKGHLGFVSYIRSKKGAPSFPMP